MISELQILRPNYIHMWEQEYREDKQRIAGTPQPGHGPGTRVSGGGGGEGGCWVLALPARASRRATGLMLWSITRHQDAKFIKAQDPPTVYNRAILQKYNPFDCKQV